MKHAPNYAAVIACRERTDYAQRKASRGIRIERIRGRVCVVRTVAAQALQITSYQFSRFSR